MLRPLSERAISGTDGLESIRSTSFEGNAIVLATFRYGTDMPGAEAHIEAAVAGISFPRAGRRKAHGRPLRPPTGSPC